MLAHRMPSFFLVDASLHAGDFQHARGAWCGYRVWLQWRCCFKPREPPDTRDSPCSGAVLPLIDAFHGKSIQWITSSHEQPEPRLAALASLSGHPFSFAGALVIQQRLMRSPQASSEWCRPQATVHTAPQSASLPHLRPL